MFGSDQVEPLPGGQLRYRGLPVLHGTSQPMHVLGGSTAEPNQSFALPARADRAGQPARRGQ